jgi:hypothetical protein
MAATLRPLAAALLGLLLLPAAALGTTVDFDDTTGVITIVGDAEFENITVHRNAAGDTDTIERIGGALVNNSDLGECETRPSGTVVDCPRSTGLAVDLGEGNDRFDASGMPVPISVAGGEGVDNLITGGGADVLAGGAGNDTLTGGGGIDDYFGELGDDTIKARDSNAERISCGGGADEADNDFTDIIAECERGIDADGDGFSSTVDCNDANAGISPGAREVFDNGVDENCDGRDNPNLDRDGDGFAQPVDCDDGNGAIRPNAAEVRGNTVDENCDRRADPFAELGAVVTAQFASTRTRSRVQQLVVRLAPRGARIVLRCTGRSCPFRRAQRRTARGELTPTVLHRRFRGVRLRPGTRLRVTITAPEAIGREYTYVIQRGAPPTSRTVCRAPGQRRGLSC